MFRNTSVPPLPAARDPDALYEHLKLLSQTVHALARDVKHLKAFCVRLSAQRAHNADTAAPSFTGSDTVDQTVLEGWADDVDTAIAYINASLETIKVHATS